MQLGDLLDLSFRGRRDQPVLECADATGNGRGLTFAELEARASGLACALIARGGDSSP